MQVRRGGRDDGTVLFRRPGARELQRAGRRAAGRNGGRRALLGATVVALILANTPARDWYEHLRHYAIGPPRCICT